MIAQMQCREAERLGRSSGPLAWEQTEALAQHAEQCPHCSDSLEAVLLSDPLAATLRAPSRPPDCPPASEELIERLKALALLPVLAPSRGGSSSDSPPTSSTPPQEQTAQGQPTHQLAVGDQSTAEDEGFPSLAPPELPGDLGRLGHYRILGVLGKGGMGVVFRAFDTQLQRPVALKVVRSSLTSAARARFLREARAAAALKHDHVVTIHQVGEDGGVPFLAMELLEGQSLEARLRRDAADVAETLRVGREVALALEAAHRRGLIHRDVKPANVWLEEPSGDPGRQGCRVKLLDFGLARTGDGQQGLTAEGCLLGTPGYASPEQARGEAVDRRTDLFALGCVLYRMATGQAPYQGPDAVSTLVAVALKDPVPPSRRKPDLPPALSELIMRLLAKDPARRPESALAVAEALDAIAASEQLAPPRKAAPAAKPKPRRRWPLVAAAVVMLAVLGLAGAGMSGIWRFRTPDGKGQLVIESDDPEVKVTVTKKGAVITDPSTKRVIELTVGDYEIHLSEGQTGLQLDTKSFTITKDGKTKVKVTLVRKDNDTGLVPLDKQKRESISAAELKAAGGDKAPKELVAIFGTSRVVKDPSKGHGQVCFSPDGRTLVSLEIDYSVTFRDVATGWVLHERPRSFVTRRIASAPDGKALALAQAKDGKVLLLEMPARKEGRRFEPPDIFASQVAIGAGGRVAASTARGNLLVWDAATGKELHRLATDEKAPRLAFSPDGNLLASALWFPDATVKLWDVRTGKRLRSWEVPKHQWWAVAFHPDGKSVIAAGSRGMIARWAIDSDTPTFTTPRDEEELKKRPSSSWVQTAVAFRPDGRVVATAQAGGLIEFWDPTSRKNLGSIQLAQGIADLTYSPDGRHLATANDDGTVYVLRLAEAKAEKTPSPK